MEPAARMREELESARARERALRETLRAVLDAVDTDHQPISKDDLTYVRPSWLLKVRETASLARPLAVSDEGRVVDMRGRYLDAALWWESCSRFPPGAWKASTLERARLDKNVAYEALMAACRKESPTGKSHA